MDVTAHSSRSLWETSRSMSRMKVRATNPPGKGAMTRPRRSLTPGTKGDLLRRLGSVDSSDLCHCKRVTYLVLKEVLGSNPFHCLLCNGVLHPLRLLRLPISSSLWDDILAWNAVAVAIDHLWLDSSDYEHWAARQIYDIRSALNHRGLDLVRRIAKCHRCYYYVEGEWDKHALDSTVLRRCPVCCRSFISKGVRQRKQPVRMLACDRCLTVTDAQDSVPPLSASQKVI